MVLNKISLRAAVAFAVASVFASSNTFAESAQSSAQMASSDTGNVVSSGTSAAGNGVVVAGGI